MIDCKVRLSSAPQGSSEDVRGFFVILYIFRMAGTPDLTLPFQIIVCQHVVGMWLKIIVPSDIHVDFARNMISR